MALNKLAFKASVKRDLKALPRKDVLRILALIETLAHDPYPPGARKLATRPVWRLRAGLYRILYQVDQKHITVIVVKIGHRRAAYR